MSGTLLALHSLRHHALYAAPVRIGMGLLWLLVARLAGVAPASTVLSFGGGVFVIVFVAFNDPRAAFLRRSEPQPFPAGASAASAAAQTWRALLPSTVGVSVLAFIAVWFEPVLAALLGGVSLGLGAAGLLRALQVDPALWFDPKTQVVYRR